MILDVTLCQKTLMVKEITIVLMKRQTFLSKTLTLAYFGMNLESRMMLL